MKKNTTTNTHRQMRLRWAQSTLYERTTMTNTCTYDNIAPIGEPMIPRKEGAGICRQISHNIQGAHYNDFKATHKIEAIDELGSAMAGDQETNKPWTPANKHKYNMFMEEKFRQTRMVYSSGPADHACKYQL
jgi:hypothetical protein